MTDMEHKPNGWNLPINQMTDEEWNDYFECRKKYDKKLSIEEIKKIVKNAMHFIDSDHDKYMEESLKVPVPPNLAISYKAFNGLKAMKKFNLSLAKETYPDEF